MDRIILHVDMDAFFAAIEERDHPEYQGHPIIVGADPRGGTGRGVVSTCNYPARKFGIHSALPISQAYRRCPQGIFLPVNMELYKQVSAKIMHILSSHTQTLEQVSIDEAYLDLTSQVQDIKQATVVAAEIKDQIKKEQQLTCSIGIGPNKLISKIASDMDKPAGLTIVHQNEVQDFLAPLSVRKLPGIGPKREETLNQHGIRKIQDLRSKNKDSLIDLFGVVGAGIFDMAHGIDDRKVEESQPVKSISRQETFLQDTTDQTLILNTLDKLAAQVAKDAEQEQVSFQTITIKVRYHDFATYSKQITLQTPTTDPNILKQTARDLIPPFLKDNKPVRLLGVRVSSFT